MHLWNFVMSIKYVGKLQINCRLHSGLWRRLGMACMYKGICGGPNRIRSVQHAGSTGSPHTQWKIQLAINVLTVSRRVFLRWRGWPDKVMLQLAVIARIMKKVGFRFIMGYWWTPWSAVNLANKIFILLTIRPDCRYEGEEKGPHNWRTGLCIESR